MCFNSLVEIYLTVTVNVLIGLLCFSHLFYMLCLVYYLYVLDLMLLIFDGGLQ